MANMHLPEISFVKRAIQSKCELNWKFWFFSPINSTEKATALESFIKAADLSLLDIFGYEQ